MEYRLTPRVLPVPRVLPKMCSRTVPAGCTSLLVNIVGSPTASATYNMGLRASPLAERRCTFPHLSSPWRRTYENHVVSSHYDRSKLPRIARITSILSLFKNKIHMLIETAKLPSHRSTSLQLNKNNLVQALFEYLRRDLRHS